MEFRIADTFTDSLTRLTNEEQKAVKTTAFDLQVNPDSHGLRLHCLDGVKDKNFWSARVSSDLRIIVHQSDAAMLLCLPITTTPPIAGPSGGRSRRTP